MKNIIQFLTTLAICLTIILPISAQQAADSNDAVEELAEDSTWKKLGRLTYKKKYDEIMGFKVDYPVFTDEIKAMEGKEVLVKGYVIPVEGYKSHKEFVFSAFPYNMCFFCGGAGPETVMEVYADEDVKYSADAITLKGILKLNDSDINHLIYSLEKARVVK